MKIKHFGTLYIVATPIGNLGDMSPRAIQVLKAVTCIAAEDTRHSKSLLQQFSIQTPLIALHEHNEREKTVSLLQQLQQGDSIAVISDAGTPLISDPGYFIVRQAMELSIPVVPIPGPCAAIVALSAAGLPTDRFTFEGFLPAKTTQRKARLTQLQSETRTMIFYEAPHRVLACLQDMTLIFGAERRAVLARELTKLYETIHGAPLGELTHWVEQDADQQRGEIVLVVEGAPELSVEAALNGLEVLKILLAELPLKQAVDLAAKISGGRKNELYQQALEWKNKE